MDGEQFSDFINRERERLHCERDQIFDQHELQQKLDALNKELQAIDAYEAAKTGKSLPAVSSTSRRAGARQVRPGSRREELLRIIREVGGLSRGEILEKNGPQRG